MGKKQEPVSVIETITPAKAREYLGWNEHNRRLRESWVAALAGMILRGEWMLTHQGIAFDETGRLVDGQHRLHAIVTADKAVSMYVTRGLQSEVYRYIDGGAVRFTSDRIKLTDDQDANFMACAMVKFYLAIEGAKAIRGPDTRNITVDRIENEFLANADAYSYVANLWKRKVRGLTKAAVGAAIACYWTKNSAMAETFIEKLLSGADLPEGSPVLALRQVLMERRAGTEHQMYWKTITALKAYNDGKKITNLTAASEDFRGNYYRTIIVERAEKGRKVAATLRKQAGERPRSKGRFVADVVNEAQRAAMVGNAFAKAARGGSR